MADNSKVDLTEFIKRLGETGKVPTGLKQYSDNLYEEYGSVSNDIDRTTVAQALGGKQFHGEDYIDMGGMSFNALGHAGDAGKLPWHPTFSNESLFASNNPHGTVGLGTGGTWRVGDKQSMNHELYKDIYYPSIEQVQRAEYNGRGFDEEAAWHFKNEKGKGIDKIVMPAPYANNIPGSK